MYVSATRPDDSDVKTTTNQAIQQPRFISIRLEFFLIGKSSSYYMLQRIFDTEDTMKE